VTDQGVPASCTLRFNSVTDYLFSPIVKRIRLAASGTRPATEGSEQERFDHLARVNYKFMSYARQSMLAGDKVIHTILQPEIGEGILTILGKTYYRTISPTHMSILTDRELILIREERRRSGEDRYGGIWSYVPLNKVVALSLIAEGGNLLRLSIQRPKGPVLTLCLRLLPSRTSIGF
jgi:hypothetical protein